MPEIIYILTNPAIPDLVKIGRTNNLVDRVRSLSKHSGVPVPFEVFYAAVVKDAARVETHIHEGFGDHRINPERVLSILKLVEVEDVTPTVDFVEDEQDRQTLIKERERLRSFRFSFVDIPVGATLSFVRDENITAQVVSDRHVLFEGSRTSLTQSSLTVLSRNFGKSWSTVRVPDYWVFENETLSERRLRMETDESQS